VTYDIRIKSDSCNRGWVSSDVVATAARQCFVKISITNIIDKFPEHFHHLVVAVVFMVVLVVVVVMVVVVMVVVVMSLSETIMLAVIQIISVVVLIVKTAPAFSLWK
jgi:hypothetical protein